jgi:hypothetical protein
MSTEAQTVFRATWEGFGEMYEVWIPEVQDWASYMVMPGQDPKVQGQFKLEEFQRKPAKQNSTISF